MKDMTLEGVVGIIEGLNPTLIRLKLDAYNPEPAKKPKAKKAPGAARPQTKPGTARPAAAAKTAGNA
jgi:hypothetical protein